MSLAAQIFLDEYAKVVFVKHGEKLTFDILLETAKDINTALASRTGYSSFVDFSQCVDVNLSHGDIFSMKSFVRSEMAWRGEFLIAFIAGSQLTYGLSRMYASFLENPEIRIGIFREAVSALDWLGLPADYEIPFK